MMNSSASTLLPSSEHSLLALKSTVAGAGVVGAVVGAGAVVGRGVVGAGAGVVGGQSRLGSATKSSTGTRVKYWPPPPCFFPTIRTPPQPLSLAAHASRALSPYCVAKMSPFCGLATLHSVNPPTAKGFPVPTLISMFPDSDHFHSWLSAPVKDHISSLFAPAWTTLPVVWTSAQSQSDLMTKAGPEPGAS